MVKARTATGTGSFTDVLNTGFVLISETKTPTDATKITIGIINFLAAEGRFDVPSFRTSLNW